MEIKIIETDQEHKKMLDEYDKHLEIVMEKGEENTPNEKLKKMSLLGLIISNYEDKKYPIPKVDPISAIKFTMEQSHLRPVDMAEYFGSASRYYDIINGKRNLSLEMIKKLHKGLKIPYECLISA
jgi:HTH-type transcriptional regulator / antitoxin HigA